MAYTIHHYYYQIYDAMLWMLLHTNEECWVSLWDSNASQPAEHPRHGVHHSNIWSFIWWLDRKKKIRQMGDQNEASVNHYNHIVDMPADHTTLSHHLRSMTPIIIHRGRSDASNNLNSTTDIQQYAFNICDDDKTMIYTIWCAIVMVSWPSNSD